MFGRYLDLSGQAISRAQAQERMFAKLANPRFLLDLRPLLPAAQAEALSEESHSGLVSSRVHAPCRSAARRALGEDGGHEGTLRDFMVTQAPPSILPRSGPL